MCRISMQVVDDILDISATTEQLVSVSFSNVPLIACLLLRVCSAAGV